MLILPRIPWAIALAAGGQMARALAPRCRDIPDEYCCRTVFWDTECFNSCGVKDLKFHVFPGVNCEFAAKTEDALAQAVAFGCPNPNGRFPCDETALQDVLEDSEKWQAEGPDYACNLFCSSFRDPKTQSPTATPTFNPTAGPVVAPVSVPDEESPPTRDPNTCGGPFRFECLDSRPGQTDEEEERIFDCLDCIVGASADARDSAGRAFNCFFAKRPFCSVRDNCDSICQGICRDEVDAWVEYEWCQFGSNEGSRLGCEGTACRTQQADEDPTTAPVIETTTPTNLPTKSPTDQPTISPTGKPTSSPTDVPTSSPTDVPTSSPTDKPTSSPTDKPTNALTKPPTIAPTASPSSEQMTELLTNSPGILPTDSPTSLTEDSLADMPTHAPTVSPNGSADQTAPTDSSVNVNPPTTFPSVDDTTMAPDPFGLSSGGACTMDDVYTVALFASSLAPVVALLL